MGKVDNTLSFDSPPKEVDRETGLTQLHSKKIETLELRRFLF